jgi:hypothetical protein
MIIKPNLLLNDPFIMDGLASGVMRRCGGGIRWAAGQGPHPGAWVRHLLETPETTNSLMREEMPTLLRGARSSIQAVNQLGQVSQTLSNVLQLSQVAAAASVLNLGVSVVGFAYMGYKLHQIQNALASMQDVMVAGFDRIEGKLDKMSGQLVYLVLLVEENAQEQQRLGDAIAELHRAFLVAHVADLQAMMLDRSRFPDGQPKEAILTASRVRLKLSDQALRHTPELDARVLLLADISTQGWAAATAAEANLLLEIGQAREARQLLESEAQKFTQHAQKWAGALLRNERPQLATAYRFAAPRFAEHVSPARVERICAIAPEDRELAEDGARRKRRAAELELEMSHSAELGPAWDHRQLAIAEYLDGLSELSARLDSLQAFAAECEIRNVSSHELLPEPDAEAGLYLLKPAESKDQ